MKILTRVFGPVVVFLLLFAATGLKGQSVVDKSRIRLAQEYERRGNYEFALRIFETLHQQVPRNQLYYEGMKRNLLRLMRYEALIALIETQIKLTDDVKYQADLGDVFYKQGNEKQAFEIWNGIVQQNARYKAVYTYVANAMVSNRLFEQAIAVYLEARKNLNDPRAFTFELANIYIIRVNYEAATKEYLDYLETIPAQFNYIEGRIASYTKDPEQARKIADILQTRLSRSKHPYLIRKLLADLYLRIEDYGNALKEFKQLENDRDYRKAPGLASGKEIYFFAEKALQAGNYTYAEEAFNLILSNFRQSPYRAMAMFGLAFAKQKQGQTLAALQSYQALIQTSQKSPWAEEAEFQTGEIYFHDRFDLPNALQAYHKVIRDYPNGKTVLEAHFRIGDCFLAQGKFAEAKTWYQRTLSYARARNKEMQDRVWYKLAYADYLAGDFKASLATLAKITQKMASLKGEQAYVNDALDLMYFIEDHVQKDSLALKRFSEAQALLLQKKDDVAKERLKQILQAFPESEIIDKTLVELAEIENRQQAFTAAIAHLQRLLEKRPDSVLNAFAQKRIAEIYETGLADLGNAAGAYEKVLIRYPESVYIEEVRQKLRKLQARMLNN